jgi:RimJ/RimL family protein N-acetyltransferase
MSSPEAMRYWSTLPHESLAVTEAWFPGALLDPDPARDEFVIERKGRVIGNVGMWKMPEFGFILHPDVWGQGFGIEAASAYLAHAFAAFPLDAVTADVDPRNAGSLRLLENLGFVETGRAERTFLLGAEWCDSVYLALRRPTAQRPR